MAVDFEGPLLDFYEQTKHIRQIIVAIESAAKGAPGLIALRAGIDLASINVKNINTVNAMALVLLASSFEECVREELGQCADHLSTRYAHLADGVRHSVRGSYWNACVDRLRFSSTILTKNKPKVPDAKAIAGLKGLLDSARGFVIADDATLFDRKVFLHHSNNFRPSVVDEIAYRIGIKGLLDDVAESGKLKAYFGVTSKKEVIALLRPKLNEFYDLRNEIVHSLNSSAGYAVDVVVNYIELFEAVADSIKTVLSRTALKW